MGWSEFYDQEVREMQARVDKEISELKEQIAALTKERDQAIYRMQRIEAEELPNLVRELAAAQGREAKLREAMLAVLCNPDGVPCFEGSDGDRAVIAEALALPTSTLDARLAGERGRTIADGPRS